ncbi:ParA family protein [Salinibacterium sp. G-O1]|uniref:ParA family protein n=1 Tax=Salinibacterium sp. G-O1 TaxID=3046208 RepID=UPI0024BBB1F3|nr:ParA family protein [Salinibacterium sp. G-O1]MDJ0336552.1 ParA family protein [Salinibacterium sp. G-O1]
MPKTLNRSALDRVIAVINGKGGVLKTTLTANIGGMLAASGYRVLLVDLDPQGNLAEDLGYTDDERGDDGAALARALMFGGGVEPIKGIRQNLDVFAGGLQLDKATGGLAVMANKDPDEAKLAVARILEPIAANYDMILIDCPPGDETLQTAAVAAARYALVPVKTDKSSRKGLTAVAARLDAVLDINPTLDLLGVVLVDVGTPSQRKNRIVLRASEIDARKHIAELFNSDHDVVLTATVRHSEATAHATREKGLLVYELDEHVRKGPKWFEIRRGDAEASTLAPQAAGSVADDLKAITDEVVARITAAETQEQSA